VDDPSAMIEQLPDLVNADAALVRRGGTLTVDVLLERIRNSSRGNR